MRRGQASNKLTLLRRYKIGEPKWEADAAIERMATDDELTEVYRNPRLWSYVVRDPTGTVCGRGEAETQQECLDVALGHAAFAAQDAWDDISILWDGWRFLLWPPDGAPRGVAP
jgi:hypothetical protein